MIISISNQKDMKGFTLIEMLLVVLIISILAATALTASMAARDRAKNSRIKAELGQVRIQAVSIKNDTDSYADLCNAGILNGSGYPTSLGILDDDIFTRTGEHVECYAGVDVYCVQAKMTPSGYFCIDSAGYTGSSPADCDGTYYTCAND